VRAYSQWRVVWGRMAVAVCKTKPWRAHGTAGQLGCSKRSTGSRNSPGRHARCRNIRCHYLPPNMRRFRQLATSNSQFSRWLLFRVYRGLPVILAIVLIWWPPQTCGYSLPLSGFSINTTKPLRETSNKFSVQHGRLLWASSGTSVERTGVRISR